MPGQIKLISLMGKLSVVHKTKQVGESLGSLVSVFCHKEKKKERTLRISKDEITEKVDGCLLRPDEVRFHHPFQVAHEPLLYSRDCDQLLHSHALFMRISQQQKQHKQSDQKPHTFFFFYLHTEINVWTTDDGDGASALVGIDFVEHNIETGL